MADHIKIMPAEGTWVVRAGGAVIGESHRALELVEGSYPMVIYFPREDIGMAFLDRSSRTSHSPHMGEATYYSIVMESSTLPDKAWSYETPLPGMEAIAGHLAFYVDPENLQVERI